MRKTSIICYDLPTISSFFKSVAYIHAIERHTRVQWVKYTDSDVLNIIYAAGSIFGKVAPGTAEVKTSDIASVEKTADELHVRYLTAWSRKVMEGGAIAGMKYVSDMEALRESSRKSLASLRADANDINSGIERDVQRFVVGLARVRLASTIGVAVIGAGAGLAIAGASIAAGGAGVTVGGLTAFGLPLMPAGMAGMSASAAGLAFSGVGASYSVVGDVVKTWEAGGTAGAVAITGAKAVADKTAGDFGQKTLVDAVKTQSRSAQVVEDAMRTFTQQSLRLAKGGLKKIPQQKATKSIATSQATVATNRAALVTAKTTGKVAAAGMRAVPVVFAAWDILNAVEEYRETVK